MVVTVDLVEECGDKFSTGQLARLDELDVLVGWLLEGDGWCHFVVECWLSWWLWKMLQCGTGASILCSVMMGAGVASI